MNSDVMKDEERFTKLQDFLNMKVEDLKVYLDSYNEKLGAGNNKLDEMIG